MSRTAAPHLCEDRLKRAPILVVDADPQVRRVIWWTLEEAGFPVETAASGWEALLVAARSRPALVILDLGLAGCRCPDVAAVMRAILGRGLPVLLLSDSPHGQRRAHRIPGAVCLPKPVKPADLVAAVAQLGAQPRFDASRN